MAVDAYFSVDVETDGPIPGPYSMLSFAIVFAGTYDGTLFKRPLNYESVFYQELKPISSEYEPEAMSVNGLNRDALLEFGTDPAIALTDAANWINYQCAGASPVLVAFPLSFDWTWLYWYFIRFSKVGSPFNHSRCFDIKTAISVKSRIPISASGRRNIPLQLRSSKNHTHHAIDDAIEQAEVFANVFEWEGANAGARES